MGAGSSWRSSTKRSDRRLAVARVLGAKGLTGGVRVEPLTDYPERLEAGGAVWLEGSEDRLTIERVEAGGRATVLYFEGVTTREAAESLAGRYLEAEPRVLGSDEYYWHELVGLRVEDSAGVPLGELVEVFRAGGNEVYRVEGPAGEVLIPALRSAVRSIDLATGRMVVAPDDAEEVR